MEESEFPHYSLDQIEVNFTRVINSKKKEPAPLIIHESRKEETKYDSATMSKIDTSYNSAVKIYLEKCELSDSAHLISPLSERSRREIESIKRRLHEDYINVLIVGGYGTGKTSFCEQFVRGTFPDYKPTNFDVNYIKEHKSLGFKFEILVTDTCSTGDYTSLFPQRGIKEADIIIIMASVNDDASCDEFLESQIRNIKAVKEVMEYNYYTMMVLLNKIDLISDDVRSDKKKRRYVKNFEKARLRCEELDVSFRGCTCIHTTIVNMTMQTILARYISKLPFAPYPSKIRDGKKKKKKKKKSPAMARSGGHRVLSLFRLKKK